MDLIHRRLHFRTLWTPAALSSYLWLDAADAGTVTTVSGYVSAWSDKSGNSRGFAQSTAGYRPAYQSNDQNGLNTIHFDGTDDYLYSSSASSIWAFLHGTTASNVFLVYKAGVVADPELMYVLYGTTATAAASGTYVGHDTRSSVPRDNVLAVLLSDFTYGYALNATGNNAAIANSYNILNVVNNLSNTTTANKAKISSNGNTFITNNTTTGALGSGVNPKHTMYLGTSENASSVKVSFLNGNICEMLVFNSELSSANRSLVEGYLAWKWGTQSLLPSDHTYKNSPPR
jgi:hypothetical protein